MRRISESAPLYLGLGYHHAVCCCLSCTWSFRKVEPALTEASGVLRFPAQLQRTFTRRLPAYPRHPVFVHHKIQTFQATCGTVNLGRRYEHRLHEAGRIFADARSPFVRHSPAPTTSTSSLPPLETVIIKGQQRGCSASALRPCPASP